MSDNFGARLGRVMRAADQAGNTMQQIVAYFVGKLSWQAWHDVNENLQGGVATESQKLKHLAAHEDQLVQRAVALRELAAKVLEQSSPEAVENRAARAQALVDQALDAYKNSDHAARMVALANASAVESKRTVAEQYLNSKRNELAIALKEFNSAPKAATEADRFKLDRLRQEVLDAEQALAALAVQPAATSVPGGRVADEMPGGGRPGNPINQYPGRPGDQGLNQAGIRTPRPGVNDGRPQVGSPGRAPVGYDSARRP